MAFLHKVRWEIKPGMQTQFYESADVLAEAIPTPPRKNSSKPLPLSTRTLARAHPCSTPTPILTPRSKGVNQRQR